MYMSSTKSILSETASLPEKTIHHEERANSSPENLPNITIPLDSNREEVNGTFTFKDATIPPDRLDFWKEMSNEIGAHEIEKHWNLVRRRELNW